MKFGEATTELNNLKSKLFTIMKKIFYIVLVLVVSSFVFSACTKEEVKPQTNNAPGTGTIKE